MAAVSMKYAPGAPGTKAHWTTSAKEGVGTAVGPQSKVWFSLSEGIVNEVYYPQVDKAAIKELHLAITCRGQLLPDERQFEQHQITPIDQGIPGYRLTNISESNRCIVTKTIIADPDRDVLLQSVEFSAISDDLATFRVYALLSPHLSGLGSHSNAWIGDYEGRPMLFSSSEGHTLAFACSVPWKARTVGYAGSSDGLQQLKSHGALVNIYDCAPDGNVGLTGEVDLSACQGRFVVAVGFGESEDDAALKAHQSLQHDFAETVRRYTEGWREYQEQCFKLDQPEDMTGNDNSISLYRTSTSILKVHESKDMPGGIIASLSIPWGRFRGNQDVYGYHVVWPRDLVEAGAALLAAGRPELANQSLRYLIRTQEADGHWPQNMWIDGSQLWQGIQTDETAFFILLVDLLRENQSLEDTDDPWPAVRNAAGYLIRYGPSTQQDRWEENSGYSVYTLSVVIASLVAAADFADTRGEANLADFLRETADSWFEMIDSWTYVQDTALTAAHDVDGYYVRITPKDGNRLLSDPSKSTINIKNLAGQSDFPVSEIVSPDVLGLVRFGLRSPTDPRIVNTLKVVDKLLKVETSSGPVWHRYSHDGYGEQADGSPFEGSGTGRGWPLLVGERAHYEAAAGNTDEARRLMRAMSCMTSAGGLLPEQIWESADIPERKLFNGKPSGSGMPLVWAHSEYIKLIRTIKDGKVFGISPHAARRFLGAGDYKGSAFDIWRFDYTIDTVRAGRKLRVQAVAPFKLHWGGDYWSTVNEDQARDSGIGLYFVDIDTSKLTPGSEVNFTFFWSDADRWEGRDFRVTIAEAKGEPK